MDKDDFYGETIDRCVSDLVIKAGGYHIWYRPKLFFNGFEDTGIDQIYF